ncbi:DNA polymerase lambda-like [Quercus lobata]|uniref:DNA polymerase lambda-like n=1 Tax=Quercus lobata TaxID=97700 RepID=UPI0012492B5D|nr:DNA polymerase lambda-like [Quercus lobata]
MAPKTPKNKSTPQDPDGILAGMVVFLVQNGVQPRRLQIRRQKLVQMGPAIEERLSKRVTHLFAMNSEALLKQVAAERLERFKGRALLYQWLEDSLRLGWSKLVYQSYHHYTRTDNQTQDLDHITLTTSLGAPIASKILINLDYLQR